MNSYDFLQSLGQVDGRLIDETMDCMFKNKEKHGKNFDYISPSAFAVSSSEEVVGRNTIQGDCQADRLLGKDGDTCSD